MTEIDTTMIVYDVKEDDPLIPEKMPRCATVIADARTDAQESSARIHCRSA